MFVGDSLSLNQWQSLVCMIYASVPNAKTSLDRKDPLSSVTFQVLPAVFSAFFHSKHISDISL